MSNGLHNLLICCGPIPPGGTPGCCAAKVAARPCSYTTSTADYCHAHGGHLTDTGLCDADCRECRTPLALCGHRGQTS